MSGRRAPAAGSAGARTPSVGGTRSVGGTSGGTLGHGRASGSTLSVGGTPGHGRAQGPAGGAGSPSVRRSSATSGTPRESARESAGSRRSTSARSATPRDGGVNNPGDKSLRVEFLKAAKGCNLEGLRKVLSQKSVDVNIKFGSGTTALMQAASKGNSECVKFLINSGADVNLHDFNHRTAAMHSVQNRSTGKETLALLLDANADVEIIDKFGESAIFKAVAKNNVECVTMLIAAGADVNTVNNADNTPLAMAAIYGHVQCLKELGSAGASVNVKNFHRSTPLIMAMRTFNVLRFGNAQKRVMHRKTKDCAECCEALLEFGSNVNSTNEQRETALYCAIRSGFLKCVKLVLKANADVRLASPNNVRDFFSFHFLDDPWNKLSPEGRLMFYAAGDLNVRLDYDFRHSVSTMKGKRMDLRNKCREIIRETLLQNIGDSNMFYLADKLPLPNTLKSLLLYNYF